MACFAETASIYADQAALRWRSDASWSSLTWAEYQRAVDDVASGLLRWHLEPGDRVALLASNRPEWHVADMAILSNGLVTVPIYPTSAAGQAAYVLRHSGARLFVTDNRSAWPRSCSSETTCPTSRAP